MPKITLFIASKTEQENLILQKRLESLTFEFTGLNYAGVHPAGLAACTDRLTAAVIINVPEWNTREEQCLIDLRKTGYTGPVLVTAKADQSSSLKELIEMKDVTFLDKPFETRDLVGLVRKMLKARQIAQQVHRRFPTAQEAEIESASGKLITRVRNLSKGGAYLEFLTAAPLRVGETVKLRMELKDLNRTYVMPARVVWTARSSSRGAGVGLEFTGTGDVKSLVVGY